MFLDRLESGVLLYETQQGRVGVELTLWQRVYLLWTFRNFRQLSVLLLNSRQRALVSALFRNNAGTVSHMDGLRSVVGVIENFVPPPMDLSMSQEREPPATEVAQSAEILLLPSLEVVPPPNSVGESSTQFIWFRRAATIAGLLLCISALVWHRSQSLSKALAHNQTPLQSDENVRGILQDSARPAFASESAAAIDSVAIPVHPPATSKEAIKAASLATVVPSHKRSIRPHDSASIAKISVAASAQDGDIQATRAPLRCVYPTYPNGRVRGKVALTARVDSDGVVRSVRIVSGNRTLAAAAVRAVRQWRYGPYVKDGHRVATESNIFISFIAEDAISMSFPPSIEVTR
jgi:TonB family protein